MSSPTLQTTSIASLPLIARGKVRDIYAVGDTHLLLVTTDRLSAFDVVFPTPIPDKGRILNAMSLFWFAHLSTVVPNHLSGIDPEDVVLPEERDQVRGRAVVAKKLHPLPVEAVVRGYLEGSGWKEYQSGGRVCGIPLPAGLQRADRLPEAIFTPATKAEVGAHDENIAFEIMEQTLGTGMAHEVRSLSLTLYRMAAEYALSRGIIIADTKFEFGLDDQGRVTLMDEVLTPDSSRFWSADSWKPGISPDSFDKQFVRNWLESREWDKRPPAPALPDDIVLGTSARYREAFDRLTTPATAF